MHCGAVRGLDGAPASPRRTSSCWASRTGWLDTRLSTLPHAGLARAGAAGSSGGCSHYHSGEAGKLAHDLQVPLPEPVDTLCSAGCARLGISSGGGCVAEEGVASNRARRARTTRAASRRCSGLTWVANPWQLVDHSTGRLRHGDDEPAWVP